MARDITAWVRDCQTCSQSKVVRQPAAALQPIAVPTQRFAHIHIDIVGPFDTSQQGYRSLITIIDHTSRWLEAVPVIAADTDTCVETLIGQWVARFGVPATITSDQGSQFTSVLWANMCTKLGVNHINTTAYHPQSNGMVERVHRQLKEGLKARGATTDWPEHLPWVLLNIRTTPKSDSNISAAEMLYGTNITLPAQLPAHKEPQPAAIEQLREGRHIPTRIQHLPPPEAIPPHLAAAELAYVRRGDKGGPLAQPYAGPYKIVRKGPKTFTLDMGGKEKEVSVDRLKPHTGAGATEPAAPPKRGRPPGKKNTRAPSPSPSPSPQPSPRSRSPSPGLPATTSARPARDRRRPAKLDL
jgi:transposase InsO family protein